MAIELAYINTKHPDFTDAGQVSASVNSQQVAVHHSTLICSPKASSLPNGIKPVSTFFFFLAKIQLGDQIVFDCLTLLGFVG